MRTNTVILVATSHFLIEVNVDKNRVRKIDSGHGLYYGISWGLENIYVAVRWYPKFMPTSHIENPRILVFNKDLKLIDIVKPSINAGGLHQISFMDDKLVCSCSRDDSYISWNMNDWQVWHPSSNKTHHGKDTHHFNSIWREKDRLFILGHNNGPSDIWEIDYKSYSLIGKYRIGVKSHNIWRENGELTVCNSEYGRIENVNGVILCETGGFPRGVSLTGNLRFVGISERAIRSNRTACRGHLNVHDQNWTFIKNIELGDCGQICEVRVLNQHDSAHNVVPIL